MKGTVCEKREEKLLKKHRLHFWVCKRYRYWSCLKIRRKYTNIIFDLGINLRTGLQGIFPEAHVVDVEYNDFDPSAAEERKERWAETLDINFFLKIVNKRSRSI